MTPATTFIEASRLLATLDTTPAAAALERLDAVRAALAVWPVTDAEALARALPDRVSGLGDEVSLALSELSGALAPHAPRLPRDLADLEPRLHVAWLRVALRSGNDTVLDGVAEDQLLRTIVGFSLDAVPTPLWLFERLARAGDPRLRLEVTAALEASVTHLALSPESALGVLVSLADDPIATVARAALGVLSKGWLRGLTDVRALQRDAAVTARMRAEDESIARAAIVTAGELGLREPLVTLIDDDTAPGALVAAALFALAPLAAPADLDLVLDVSATEPLRFGTALRAFLLEAHRRGVFVRDEHLDRVLVAFDAHHGWTADELVRVTHIVRASLVTRLAATPPDDARWLRRAALLAASPAPEAAGILVQALHTTHDVTVGTALLQAAGRCASFDDEDILLAWLERAPETVLSVLRVKGGARSADAADTLVLDAFTPARVRAWAIAACWAHTDDREAVIRRWATTLGPRTSYLFDRRFVTHRDDTIARIVDGAGWDADADREIEPMDRLRIFCASGERRFLPEVTRLFRALYVDCVNRALAGNFVVKRVELPALEQLVFEYGRDLVKSGRVIRNWIEDQPETGRDLVLRLVCDWLHEAPSAPIEVALLETVSRHAPSGAVLRTIEPWWRHHDANVRRAAIEAILAAGEGARGLELSLCRLTESTDPRIVVQALAAAQTLRASWAEPMVRAALDRPEMGVKKAAAEALSEVANAASIPALVFWLARHDNESFRASLQKALDRAAGATQVAVLVDALALHAEEPRARELLHRALSGRLSLTTLGHLARSSSAALQALVTACVEGTVAVAGATAHDVATSLHRARLRTVEPHADPGLELRTRGFSPEAARRLLASREPNHDARILPVIRLALPSWVSWLHDEPNAEALAWVLEAAAPTDQELFDRMLDLLEAVDAPQVPAARATFFERALAPSATRPQKVRALALLRRLPPSAELGGLRRFRLLAALGAVRTRADLAISLAACRLGPDLAHDSAALLTEALSIPAKSKDDPPALVALRERAHTFYRGAADADTWLEATLHERPIDVVPLLPLPPTTRAPFAANSQAAVDKLVALLDSIDAHERARAAAQLLAWPDARDTWPTVLGAFLDARIELPGTSLVPLATLVEVDAWPAGARQARALALVPHLSAAQLQQLIPSWLRRWDAGDADAEVALRAIDGELLLPWIRERAKRGSYTLARLFAPSSSAARRAVIALIAPHAPHEVEHLAYVPRTPPGQGAPVDPLPRTFDELSTLLGDRRVELGLAVRAVHALVEHGPPAARLLAELAVDRRPQVRSAALRALHVVAPREDVLPVTLRVLGMERRKDVMSSLMKSLAHARYEPALPILVGHLVGGDSRARDSARDALRAWGSTMVPKLRQAARRARPDHRAPIEALISELLA